MSGPCAACGGRVGECSECESDDHCVRSVERDDGSEHDVCVRCTGDYFTHQFAMRAEP